MKRSFLILLSPVLFWSLGCGLAFGGEPALQDPAEAAASETQDLVLTAEPCESGGCAAMRDGRELLSRGKHRGALERFAEAYRELPAVRDHILFQMARAFTGLGDYTESEKHLGELLEQYHDSPLRKRAKALKIRNGFASCGTSLESEAGIKAVRELVQYLADYPDDLEMKLLYGQTLQRRGEPDLSRKVFRELYVTTGRVAEHAAAQLKASDLTDDDHLHKAVNLIKDAEYQKAEALLRKVLAAGKRSVRDEAQRKLGDSLFGQKRYKEAAAEYRKAGDTYNLARSLYRAGETESFLDSLDALITMEDRRVGPLLSALAAKKRRQGRTEEAIELYERVRREYPSQEESSLWGIAWTHYRNSDCAKTVAVLDSLIESFPSQRYKYWKARCWEEQEAGSDSPGLKAQVRSLYDAVLKGPRDYYRVLAEMRSGETATAALPADFTPSPEQACAGAAGLSGSRPFSTSGHRALARVISRSSLLLAAGYREEAAAELTAASRSVAGPEIALSLARSLVEAGAYRSAIALTSRLPVRPESPGEAGAEVAWIQYPFAYWQVVTEAARTNRLDPLVLLSVMREESRFDPEVRSVAGAIGLMQIMPGTAEHLRVPGTGWTRAELRSVRTNIAIGSYYLSSLLREFGSLPAALAAYNAGEERVREWLRMGAYRSADEFIEDIPYDETRNYVKKVLATYAIYRARAMQDPDACGPQPAR